MIFAVKIIEEGTLAYVGGFCNVFHGDIGKAALGKELKRATEKAQPGLGRAALATHGAHTFRPEQSRQGSEE